MNPFFIIVFLIYTAINAYIFYKTRRVIPHEKIVRYLFSVVFVFLYGAFFVVMLGRNVIPLGMQKILYFPGTCWLGIMFYLFLFFLLTDLVWGLACLFRLFKKSGNFLKIQVLTGYILTAGLMIYGYYRFTHPEISEQDIVINKSAGIYKELKIVGLSDLHLGVNIDKNRLKKIVQLANRQNPDLILIAGDIIDNNVLPLMREKMWEEFGQMRAPLGVYACLGNHEYLSGIEPSMDFLRKTNIRLLVDSVVLIDNSFWLVGRDDIQGNPNRKPLVDLVAETDTSLPLFLLDHEPVNLNDAEQNNIDLQFSGHTHFGQIFPINLLVKRMYETAYGYARKGNTQYYISSGIGLWGPPVRIGTNSEVAVFNVLLSQRSGEPQ
ncbi:MAG: metallophosphoesterase [Dysgonamonadaceae bacterium]|jgi:predicted MPP superfamily phosphohydrolase|nr:metallophosphoesterase [Dysgonamonadaceae bacterium]